MGIAEEVEIQEDKENVRRATKKRKYGEIDEGALNDSNL